MHTDESAAWVTLRDDCINGQALGLLVLLSSTHCCASTRSLSTRSSTGDLTWLPSERPNLRAGFPLRCFQRLSVPDIATRHLRLATQPIHQRSVHPGPLVLGTDLLKFPTPAEDRDRTVSRRSEPSSRSALIGEQPNPWDLLQPQDVLGRHRGAKPHRRYGRSGAISLLSPGYLLSVERWPFHTEPPDH